jgi:hypothetical protein
MGTAVFEVDKRKCRELRHSHGLENGLINDLHSYGYYSIQNESVCSEVVFIQDQDWSVRYVILLLLLLVVVVVVVFSLWASLAGTRAQSGDRYGSGTLRSGQVVRGSS